MWLLHEQVATAALEVGATGLAAELIRAVLRRFPKESMRAKRLQVGGHLKGLRGTHGRTHRACSHAQTGRNAQRVDATRNP